MSRDPMCIENDRLVIRSLNEGDLKGLKTLRSDQRVYCYEPTFLTELQGTPEEAIGSGSRTPTAFLPRPA